MLNLLNRKKTATAGQYFHVITNGTIERQGRIKAELDNGLRSIEWFRWLDGAAIRETIQPVKDMKDWKFYDSREEFIQAHEALKEKT